VVENLEDLREEFLKNGGHEITDAITVIKFMLSKGFSRRPKLVPLDENTVFNWFRSTFKYDLKSGFGVNKRTKFFKDKSKEFCRAFSAQPASQGLPFPGFHDDDFFETLKHYSGGLINDSNGTAVANAVAERANIVLEMKLRLAKKAEDYLSASSVNAEVVKALKNCAGKLQTYVDSGNPRSPYKNGINPFYVLGSKEALKDAEQALNSIKAGKEPNAHKDEFAGENRQSTSL